MTRRANGEGSIRRRKDGRWEARLTVTRDGIAKAATVYGKTRSEVVAKLDDLRDRAAAQQPLADSRVTVASWVEAWTSGPLTMSGRKQSTIDGYSSALATHIVPQLGHLPLKKVTPSIIEKRLHEVVQVRSASTARQVYAALRALFATAVRDGLVARDPVSLVKRPSQSRPAPRALSATEVRALVEASASHRLAALVVLVATTGLRRGEALGLTWQDVDSGEARVVRNLTRTSGGLVAGTPKSQAGERVVPLPPVAVAALKEHRQKQLEERMAAGPDWEGGDWVFCTRTGGPLEPRNVSRWYAGLAKSCGVEDTGMHALRHFAATAMLSSGATVRDVADLLGHSSPTITLDVYAKAMPEAQRRAVEHVAGLLG